MTSFLQWLLHRPLWHRLPPVPRQYSTEWHPRDVDADTAELMAGTHTRSPQGVALLMRRHHASSARALIEALPRRRRPRRLVNKLAGLWRRAWGLSKHDPMREIARRHRRTGRG